MGYKAVSGLVASLCSLVLTASVRPLSRHHQPFWIPLVAILESSDDAALQEISECPLYRKAGILNIFHWSTE